MRNDECVIKIVGRSGRLYQAYRREYGGWAQISSKGTLRPWTAEQLLSQILPPRRSEPERSWGRERPHVKI